MLRSVVSLKDIMWLLEWLITRGTVIIKVQVAILMSVVLVVRL